MPMRSSILRCDAAAGPAATRPTWWLLALAERAQAQGRVARDGDWKELAGGARALSDAYWARQRRLADAVALARAACGQVPFPTIRRDAGTP